MPERRPRAPLQIKLTSDLCPSTEYNEAPKERKQAQSRKRPVWPSDSAHTYHAQVRPFSWTDREKEQGNGKQREIVTEGSIHWLGWAVAWEKLGGSADWHVNQVRMRTRRAFRRPSFSSVHLPLISHAVNEELGGCSGTGVGAATEWEKRGQGQWSARNACVCLDCWGEDGGGDPQEV